MPAMPPFPDQTQIKPKSIRDFDNRAQLGQDADHG